MMEPTQVLAAKVYGFMNSLKAVFLVYGFIMGAALLRLRLEHHLSIG
jgi:hypothetical protein